MESFYIKPGPVQANVCNGMLQGDSVLSIKNQWVWGASVVEDADGLYHMMYSTWKSGEVQGEFQDSWVLHSKIGYAVSKYPDKNFIDQGIVLQGRALDGNSHAWDAQMVHNPHLHMFNGRYYLYYVGAKDPGVQSMPISRSLSRRDRVQQCQKIGVVIFDTFDDLLQGRYIRYDTPILSPRTRVKADNIINPSLKGTRVKPDNIVVTNPSVVYRATDKKYLLYFKGNWYNPDWRGVHGVAIGDTPAGPFIAQNSIIFDIKDKDDQVASAEDPFVWYHKAHEKFYGICKDFSGAITGQTPGIALLESCDGIIWNKAEKPFFMKKCIQLHTGEMISVNRLERPQLLVNKKGIPQVLYCACAISELRGKTDGSSCNVHIPIVE